MRVKTRSRWFTGSKVVHQIKDKVSDMSMGTSKNDAVGVKLGVSRGFPDRGQA